ncbi:UDP-galactopyranose mutase [Desulfosediminicola sp.]|uniref:UDP-galactopyranose mutase n=1 Tax=Desulfosediminicola sp. TaxID=2886825 RepID=UPI003AF1E2CB
MRPDFLIAGAGFSGSVVAECLAFAGYKVIIVDRLSHAAGNAYDEYDTNGVLIHPYGPHIFHTKVREVYDYLSNFTKWRPYEHRVRTSIQNVLYPIPINRITVNKLYKLDLDEDGVEEYFATVREEKKEFKNSEDVIVGTVGRDLYNKFFKNYTIKQWGLDPSQLCASVTSRIPVRANSEDRYFTDKYQVMPLEGYSRLFENLLDHKNIRFEPGVDFFNIKEKIRAKHIIYTGPIDRFYDYCYGKLPYRSLRFEHDHFSGLDQYQPVGVINYPNEHDYTRITEFKHLTGQICSGTSICREYPQANGDPYYPIPRPENNILYKKYERLANKEKRVSFIGRLAQYRYYNMDQAVAAALGLVKKLKREYSV